MTRKIPFQELFKELLHTKLAKSMRNQHSWPHKTLNKTTHFQKRTMSTTQALLRIPSIALTRSNRGAINPLRAVAAHRGFATDKYDRTKPHVNIGTIGHVDHGVSQSSTGDHTIIR